MYYKFYLFFTFISYWGCCDHVLGVDVDAYFMQHILVQKHFFNMLIWCKNTRSFWACLAIVLTASQVMLVIVCTIPVRLNDFEMFAIDIQIP